MTDLSSLEHDILKVFRVTGFFGKTPKKNVSRNYSGIFRGLQANGSDVALDDIAPGLESLAQKGLLKLEDRVVYLTDQGYEMICRF